MTPDQFSNIFRDELGRIAPEIDFDQIAPDDDLREQIDIDSMDFLNLITALHQRLAINIPETDYPNFATLRGALAYLAAKTR